VEDLSKNAKKRVCIISDQVMRAMMNINLQKAKKGVEFRYIYPKNSDVPEELRAKKRLPIEVRFLDEVHLSMKFNEKSGGLALPGLDNKIDYGFGLMGSESQFLRWMELLFDYYWEKAESTF
ncbi:MAG: hypothetical protein JSV56_13155, partial [Methanomassiliicoccales archaeon]